MRELTKAERHEVYKRALVLLNMWSASDEYKSNTSPYICDNISDALSEIKEFKWVGFDQELIVKLFPEFTKHKPEKIETVSGMGWWNKTSTELRIEILTQCIKETQP